MNNVEHTANYDASMTGRPKSYYCRRCRGYVTRSHVEDMRAEAAPEPNERGAR